ncbi:MAG: TetR/AcrR family transcriptional regulator C-terminal domain-containing protein, partial [Burkholderiaceae bacterium]
AGSKLHGLNRRYSQFLIRTIEDGIDRGELRADLDVAVARDLLFGGLEHVGSTRLGRGRRLDPSKLAREIAAQFLDGWGDRSRQGANDELARRLERVERRLDLLAK